MPLTDTQIRNAKPTAKAFKLSDGGGMYLIVIPANARYWRMDYRFAGRRRTLAIGVYPTVSLATARARRDEARALLAKNIDPVVVKRASKRAAKLAHENTFEAVAREWIGKQQRRLAPKYSALLLARLEADIFPQLGARPVTDFDAPELLQALRKVEKRGVIETARRLRQTCGQVFRYAIATGRAKTDPTAALRGALGAPGRPRGHKAMALREMPNFLRALEAYDAAPREPSGTSAPLQCGASFCADAIQSIGSPIDNRADLVDGLTFDCALATDAVAIPPQGSSDQSFAAPRLVATGQQQIKCVAAKSAASTGQRIL